jgi:hypothetical protein
VQGARSTREKEREREIRQRERVIERKRERESERERERERELARLELFCGSLVGSRLEFSCRSSGSLARVLLSC